MEKMRIVLVDDWKDMKSVVERSLRDIGIEAIVDLRLADSSLQPLGFVEPSVSELDAYDIGMLDLELFPFERINPFSYSRPDLHGGTVALPHFRRRAPWLPIIGTSKLFSPENIKEHFISIAGSFGFDGLLWRESLKQDSFNHKLFTALLAEARGLRLCSCMGCTADFTSPPTIECAVDLSTAIPVTQDDFVEAMQVLFWYSRRAVIERGRRGRSGAAAFIAHVTAGVEEGLREATWFVKANSAPSALHSEAMAHRNMVRKGMPHARMVQTLWPNVVRHGGLSLLAYQLVRGSEPGAFGVADGKGALDLVDKLKTALSELNVHRVERSGAARSTLKRWFGEASRYEGALAGLRGAPIEAFIKGVFEGNGPEVLDRAIRFDSALIHGDFHSENILVGKDVVFIDFAMSAPGPVAYDCAKLYRDLILRTPKVLEDGFNGWGHDELSRRLAAAFKIDGKKHDMALVEVFSAAEFVKGLTSTGYELSESQRDALLRYLNGVSLSSALEAARA